MANHQKVKEFYLWDHEGTLFPMETCRLLIEHNGDSLSDYISKIANTKEKDFTFLSQETVYASKTQHHLRRTMKLDPVAEYYLYDMAYKNRKIFRKNISPARENIGYRFVGGKPISIHESYKEFTVKAEKLRKAYKYFIKFDISAYFNSIYHHDMTNWFSSQKTTQADTKLFGQYMREINTGFSIDFLPHGLYPSKMLGSHFLSFMDHSELVKSEHMIRFMDDYMLFSNSKDTLIKDFETVQKGLGQKSLNLNTDKTVLFAEKTLSISEELDDIKSQIMEKVDFESGSGVDYEEYQGAHIGTLGTQSFKAFRVSQEHIHWVTLVEQRRQLISERVRITNRLRAALKQYYPNALEWFDHVDTILFRDFIDRWPTLAQAKRARTNTLKRFFSEHNMRFANVLESRVEAIKKAIPLTEDEAIVVPYRMKALAMVRQLKVLLGTIKEFDNEIDRIAMRHPTEVDPIPDTVIQHL